MFTKKSHTDVKKSTLKIQDCKKDSQTRLRHLKTILDHVDLEEAKSLFESNYSHVYYVLYDTFIQAESNLKQRVHKAHREELDGSLWLLGKILCLLPELIAKRWQCHSLGRIMNKLLHPGNSVKLRREGVRYFLLWYQAMGENAPPQVHTMFADLVPGLSIPQKGAGLNLDTEYAATDILNHPNMKLEMGTSVFHDTGIHPVRSPEISPLLPPGSNERTAAPDPRDGLEILLDCMVQATGCIKWRENTPQKHMRSFHFLLNRFQEVYLPVFCPNFDHTTSIYEPKLDLPMMRTISRRDEVMSSCVVVLVNWMSRFTHEKGAHNRMDSIAMEEDIGENASLLWNLRQMGFSQAQLVRDVLYSTRETVNFVHEVYRQAFLLGYTSKAQIEAIKIAIAVYRDWMSNTPPPFLLEPNEDGGHGEKVHRNQRLRTDSYIGAIYKENLIIRAGLQNVLQVFVTHASNVFMIHTEQLNIIFQSKSRDITTSALDEQTDICKRVLNIYRTMVMNTRMDGRSWEQLLMVLLQITSVILSDNASSSKKNTLGGRLAQPIFQTLIVTWIRAHTNVHVNTALWEKFLSVLSSLTHREELIIEWDKTMQTLTRVLARQVYNLNLQDLPLDRLAESKGKRRRGVSIWQQSDQQSACEGQTTPSSSKIEHVDEGANGQQAREAGNQARSIPGTPALNRSYSEGSLAPNTKRLRSRKRLKHHKVPPLPVNVEHSLSRMLSNTPTNLSISSEALNTSRSIQAAGGESNTLRRALSLDSIRPPGDGARCDDSRHDSRSPSPTASSGIEGGSIKDSPLQIDMMTGDSSSIDTQDDGNVSSDRRSILAGGAARGWLPDVAAIMWKRMLGALGDVNEIQSPKLHAQIFRHLVDMTSSLIKIRLNQGITNDNQTTPQPPALVPPIGLIAPWCFGALALDNQYREGKVCALQLLCTMVKNSQLNGMTQLPLFYSALHQALTGVDRELAYTALRFLGGPRFLSLLLPGHTLLLLDLVHASTVLITSSNCGSHAPRSEVAGLLGSLLCFPKTSLPKPVLNPSGPHVELMECPDLQEHVLNVIMRCARREPTSKARCIAIAALGQWIVQNLSNFSAFTATASGFTQQIPSQSSQRPDGQTVINPRITEAVQIILQALQFKNRTIARIASETLKLCAEKGKSIAKIERLPQMIVNALCVALEIQNTSHPKESDKVVINSLLLCLGEFCMQTPVKILQETSNGADGGCTLIMNVLRVLHHISTGTKFDRVKLLTADEDFDMTITVDDAREHLNNEPSYQTTETTQNCLFAIRLCAKTVAMHLVTNLGHFPIGIGASRLSSMVDEQDDLSLMPSNAAPVHARESIDLGTPQVLTAPNLQLFMLNKNLVASFVELPTLKLPGGGITAGLVTADRQVRLLLRDINGKACWDASVLYREPRMQHGASSLRFSDQHSSLSSGISSQTKNFGGGKNNFMVSLDPLTSIVGMPLPPVRHTLRHRPPGQLPVASDLEPDLDQLDDLLQYIGHTSPECLDVSRTPLNTAGPTPVGNNIETQAISIILNQKNIEQDYIARHSSFSSALSACSVSHNVQFDSFTDENLEDSVSSAGRGDPPFHYCRLLFSHLGLASWEKRQRTNLLTRTDKLLRELRNLDTQKCRETHKMAVIYVGAGQEDKNSILRNTCGSSTYEMFVSALGWEIELESHNGFLGGLPRTGCGSTAPYYATPFLEAIYHVATRMPSDTPEAILNKTRHLGNDEVHIIWSEHSRDYRRDILPTEFCDVLIVVYPLRSGLFRVTVNRKADVPWFGPIWDEAVVGGACLATLVRATAINASRAKRTSLNFYQQFYEERHRSLETVASRHKESTTFEEFAGRVFSPIQSSTVPTTNTSGNPGGAPLAAALIDHQKIASKNWMQHLEIGGRESNSQQSAVSGTSAENPSPRPLRKITHPFKGGIKRASVQHHHHQQSTPPDSPTLPGRKFK
ncbi:probable Rho GTPase-activating protein CG5521 isoform X2 [Lutzomyia longipalpis]|uniref:probable Rho GTPase-activating protein CG5521 isoform X2 n=1 Tax=Lutzomyia longipalpis TaxID=7200 RepID=UPI0024846670|nr:probable Rho GTPase-activating protein CG5521 isoform X2 [Lutzomyia longipalpis]